jgi:alkylhydroperoxidase family enzyme
MSDSRENDQCYLNAAPFVPPPDPLPFPFGAMIAAAERKIGGRMDGMRVLAGYPKALIGAGLMEAFVAHDEPDAPRRLLALVRLRVSYEVSCPFCIDLNGQDFGEVGISADELAALRGDRDPEETASFSEAEKAAIAFAGAVSRTPVRVSERAAARVSAALGARGFVIVAATAAQVNFWARLFQGLGAPPSGVAADPQTLALERFANTLRTTKKE